MTNKEAKKWIVEHYFDSEDVIEVVDEQYCGDCDNSFCKEYIVMGRSVEALNKRIAKPVNNIEYGWDGFYHGKCPSCGEHVDFEDDYCVRCGQALDWAAVREDYFCAENK